MCATSRAISSGCGSSILARRDVLLNAGGYDPRLRAAGFEGGEDYLLQLKIARERQFAVVPEYLVGYRLHGRNMSHDPIRMLMSGVHALRLLHEEDPSPPSTFRPALVRMLLEASATSRRNGDLPLAGTCSDRRRRSATPRPRGSFVIRASAGSSCVSDRPSADSIRIPLRHRRGHSRRTPQPSGVGEVRVCRRRCATRPCPARTRAVAKGSHRRRCLRPAYDVRHHEPARTRGEATSPTDH